ncbi:TPA: hypothetical protein EYN98_21070 [Candidatus Poribacteria bacterium]|nr:hypothetical protein [Candidatus Poribacteria bacterium]HIA68484.1 hypothetical protein [Candidatus Poribacteria bacterium]
MPIEIIVKLRIESTRSDLEKTAQKPVAIAINPVSPPTISVRKKSILTRIFCLRFPVGRQTDQMMKKFGPNRFIGSVELNRKNRIHTWPELSPSKPTIEWTFRDWLTIVKSCR